MDDVTIARGPRVQCKPVVGGSGGVMTSQLRPRELKDGAHLQSEISDPFICVRFGNPLLCGTLYYVGMRTTFFLYKKFYSFPYTLCNTCACKQERSFPY